MQETSRLYLSAAVTTGAFSATRWLVGDGIDIGSGDTIPLGGYVPLFPLMKTVRSLGQAGQRRPADGRGGRSVI